MSSYRYCAILADKLSKKDYQCINRTFNLDIKEDNPTHFIYSLGTDQAYLLSYSNPMEFDLEFKFFPNFKSLIDSINAHKLNQILGV